MGLFVTRPKMPMKTQALRAVTCLSLSAASKEENKDLNLSLYS